MSRYQQQCADCFSDPVLCSLRWPWQIPPAALGMRSRSLITSEELLAFPNCAACSPNDIGIRFKYGCVELEVLIRSFCALDLLVAQALLIAIYYLSFSPLSLPKLPTSLRRPQDESTAAQSSHSDTLLLFDQVDSARL
jgi:hypothetical protein